MYVTNFVSQGKTPKALQIFGDSYGHYSDEETWIGLIAKELGIPVLNYSYVGSPNLRTISLFTKYYDENCLNIFLITGSDRIYINDDLFIVAGINVDQSILVCTNNAVVSNENLNMYKEIGFKYMERLFNSEIVHIQDNYMVERLFSKQNTIFIYCFNRKRFFSEHYKHFYNTYNFNVPNLLGSIALWDISTIQFLDDKDKNIIISDEAIPTEWNEKGTAKYINYFNIKPTSKHGSDCKNHMSKATQCAFAKIFLDILHTGKFEERYIAFKEPGIDEIIQNNSLSKEKQARTANFLKFGNLNYLNYSTQFPSI
jgi:hypothetical protein